MKNESKRISIPWLRIMTALVIIFFGSGVYSSGIAGDEKTYQSLKIFADVLQEIESNYVDTVDTEKLIQSAIKGMVVSLDPHSTFMPPEAFDELQDDTKGEFGGIGIVITLKKGILTVISPIEGTPAYEAGVQAGDVIIKIDGTSTKDMELWESVKMMRGPRGETVVITIVRDGEPEPMDFSLKRDIIPMESVRSDFIAPGYGYVWITNFRTNTTDDMEKALKKLEAGQDLKGMIIDLRNNPGGLLNQAVEISDLFLEEGLIVSIKGRLEKHTEEFKATPNETKRNYPIVVLINGGSASASEIVAGALQDHKRAVILGSTSFGKGSVQSVRPLREGFGIKYTIARYYTPNGTSIQAEGIKPDIEVEHSIIEPKKEKKKETVFDRMLREKDLKNHLEPEASEEETTQEKKDKEKKPAKGLLDFERLKRDSQVKRALDILLGYEVFISLGEG